MSKLARANLLVLGLLVLHIVDHGANQPTRAMPGSAELVGVGGFVVVAVSCVLAIRRSELAPAASLFTGVTTALGFVVVHLLPTWWGWVSDPFWDFDANALSWALLIAPILASAYLATIAARELRPYAEQPG